MSRVIVFGGTGRTGQLIAARAADAGHRVTVAARHPENLSAELIARGIVATRVDVTEAAAVRKALLGQDALVLAVSTPARRPDGLYSHAAHAIVDAAPADMRAVIISSGGVHHDDPALPFWYRRILIPLAMNELYTDMSVMETTIRASTLDWVVVRASYLRDDPATGSARIDDGSTPKRGWRLSRADLADFAVQQLTSSEWIGRTPTLAR